MADDGALRRLMNAIAGAEDALALLDQDPELARAVLVTGASREDAAAHYLTAINHYIYAGDTALHVAAAAHRRDITARLLALGANAAAINRRGATPLHYAADGVPGSEQWNPEAQTKTITCLIAAGADPDALDQSGVAPLHRAVRTRCASAVEALLDGCANMLMPNKKGSTAMALAQVTSGRGGSGSAEAKAEQAAIIALLERHGAAR